MRNQRPGPNNPQLFEDTSIPQAQFYGGYPSPGKRIYIPHSCVFCICMLRFVDLIYVFVFCAGGRLFSKRFFFGFCTEIVVVESRWEC